MSARWCRSPGLTALAVASLMTACGAPAQQVESETASVRVDADREREGARAEADPSGALVAAAERDLLAALSACPRASISVSAAGPMANPPASTIACSDPIATETALAGVLATLERAHACEGDASACGSVPRAVERSAPSTCAVETEAEASAWRATAFGFLMSARLDCLVSGAGETASCSATGAEWMRVAALGSIEISAGAISGVDALDPILAAIDAATRAGSTGASGGWLEMMLPSAVAASLARHACVVLPLWELGQGLETLAVPGTHLEMQVPHDTRAEDGLLQPPHAEPIYFGESADSLEDIAGGAPSACSEVTLARAETFRLFDCAGSDLYSPNRELWAVVDLGDARVVAIERVRHNTEAVAVRAAAALLRTIHRAAPGPALALAPRGASGTSAGWRIAYREPRGGLGLSDRIAPGRGSRSGTVIRVADAHVCTDARGHASTPTRVVLRDEALDDGGCEISVWVSDAWGARLHVLRVEHAGDAFVSSQVLVPAADEVAARAVLDSTVAGIALVRGTESAPSQ